MNAMKNSVLGILVVTAGILTACSNSKVEDSASSGAAETDGTSTPPPDELVTRMKARASDAFQGRRMTVVVATLTFSSDGSLDAWVHLGAAPFTREADDTGWDRIYCHFTASIDADAENRDKLWLGDGYRLGDLENVYVDAWAQAVAMGATEKASVSSISFDSTLAHVVTINENAPATIRAHCTAGELPGAHPSSWFSDYALEL